MIDADSKCLRRHVNGQAKGVAGFLDTQNERKEGKDYGIF